MKFTIFKTLSKFQKENEKLNKKVTHKQRQIEKDHKRLAMEFKEAQAKYESRN